MNALGRQVNNVLNKFNLNLRAIWKVFSAFLKILTFKNASQMGESKVIDAAKVHSQSLYILLLFLVVVTI